jgi:hypothetical protein
MIKLLSFSFEDNGLGDEKDCLIVCWKLMLCLSHAYGAGNPRLKQAFYPSQSYFLSHSSSPPFQGSSCIGALDVQCFIWVFPSTHFHDRFIQFSIFVKIQNVCHF